MAKLSSIPTVKTSNRENFVENVYQSNYAKKIGTKEIGAKKIDAKEILDIIYDRIFIIRDYLQKNINKYPEFEPYIKQFCKRINNLTLVENPPNNKYTSYTLNKGDKIGICLFSKETGKMHDLNLLMYVVLHELTHVACPEVDHTPLFKKIFVFFLEIGIMLNLYENVNYQINLREYCGVIVKDNLLND